ncbi:MAG: serine/threonine-protein kinase [Acidobacteriota bacterium]
MDACLSADDLAAYVAGATSERERLQRHVEACEECRRAVAAAVRAERVDRERTTSMLAPPVRGEQARSREYTLATLRDEEIRSARTMIRMGRGVGLAAILPVPLLGGVLAVQVLFVGLVIAAVAVGIVIERRIRRPERYSERAMLFLAALVVSAGLAGMLYYGIFSAAQLFPVLTIYAFSRRERFGNTLVVYLATAIGQALLAALVIPGVVQDPGLFQPHLPLAIQVVGHILIQIGDAAAFAVGWQSRRDTQAAIESLQREMVLSAKREALLQEARDDLDRANRVGGAGRYTDQTFGSYRLGNVLGRGGMGEVYDARHVDTDEPAAVKLLAPRELGNPRSVERFVREVRAIRALRSPHVVRVLAASEVGDPIPYLAMERLHGQTLAQLLRSSPPAAQLVDMLAQVGTAIEEAWALGIVHRDLKPHNLFLAAEPRGTSWKVLDFGIAALGEHGGTLTEGLVIGTPAYMAPEQARGERVDLRTDVYALSAIAYRWLTGRPVCSGDDVRASLYQVVHRTPTRPGSIAELAPDVDAVLAIGLACEPGDRWATVAELRAALATALAGELAPALRDRAARLVVRYPWGGAR